MAWDLERALRRLVRSRMRLRGQGQDAQKGAAAPDGVTGEGLMGKAMRRSAVSRAGTGSTPKTAQKQVRRNGRVWAR
jgi:hypothetical protein